MPCSSRLVRTTSLAYASSSDTSGMNRCRGTLRKVASTSFDTIVPAATSSSTRLCRSFAARAESAVASITGTSFLTLHPPAPGSGSGHAAERDNDPPALGKLPGPGRRDAPGTAGDDHAIVGSVIRDAALGVRKHDVDCVVRGRREATPGTVDHVGVDVDGGDLPGLADKLGD